MVLGDSLNVEHKVIYDQVGCYFVLNVNLNGPYEDLTNVYIAKPPCHHEM